VDGSPAVTRHRFGRGVAVHFAALPGLSYRRAARQEPGQFPRDFPATTQVWITAPVQAAGVVPPVHVDHPLVEGPLLLSAQGAALTLLNWSGEPIESLGVSVRLPRRVASVESVERGLLEFVAAGNHVSFRLPLDAADIVRVRF
jgi:hypothetical protein